MADVIDDFDYLHLLRERVGKAKAEKRHGRLVKEAESILSDEFYLEDQPDPKAYLARRNRVGELIENLK